MPAKADLPEHKPHSAQTLRSRAEAKANLVDFSDPETISPDEVKRLLHELRVHQIELELQNEELRQTQLELDQSRAHYFDLYDLAPVGYLLLSEKGRITKSNLTAASLLGVTRSAMLHKPLSAFILAEDQDKYFHYRRQIKLEGGPWTSELRMLRMNGEWFWANLETTLVQENGLGSTYRTALSNITTRKQAEAALSANRANLAALIENTDSRIWSIDQEYQLIIGNQAFHANVRAVIGRNLEQGESIFQPQVPAEINAAWRGYYDRALDGEKYSLILPTQFPKEIRWIEYYFSPIVSADGQILGATIMGRDVTRRRRAEEALGESSQKLELLFDLIPVGISILGADSKVLKHNSELERILGLTGSEITAGSYQKRQYFTPAGAPMTTADFPSSRALNGETAVQHIVIGERQDELGKTTWMDVSAVACPFSDWKAAIVTHDITALINTEAQLKRTLAEKEILLRELYHRTKNNMMVITSLIAMQEKNADSKTDAILQELDSRIQSMALVHDMLLQSQDLSSIDLGAYIPELTGLIWQNYQTDDRRLTITLKIEKIQVLLDIAVPCGLILNELMLNAIKYAFPDSRPGEIRVELKQLEDNTIELFFADNGVGVAEGFDFRAQPGLGTKIIYALGEHQLDGLVEFQSEHGVSCRLRFQNTGYVARI